MMDTDRAKNVDHKKKGVNDYVSNYEPFILQALESWWIRNPFLYPCNSRWNVAHGINGTKLTNYSFCRTYSILAFHHDKTLP